MQLAPTLEAQFREVYLSGSWIATNLKTQLDDTSWEEATTKIGSLNTIADLAFHVNYYVAGVLQVLQGGSLDIRDKYSFDYSPIQSAADWNRLREQIYADGEAFAQAVGQLPEARLAQAFVKEEYGSWYRNITVMVEHSFYHLGQIVLLKKLVREQV
jgi:uncharacterized damage-inducible protein DinB